MIETAERPHDQRRKSNAAMNPFSSVIVAGSVRQLRPGSVLIKSATEIPQLPFEVRRISGWNLMNGVDAYQLEHALRKKGWHLFFFRAIAASGVALTCEAALQAAVRKAFRRVQQLGFNAPEVAKIESRNCLGIKYARLIVHPRQVRSTPYVCDFDPHSRVERAWDFKRVRQVAGRKTRQVKAM